MIMDSSALMSDGQRCCTRRSMHHHRSGRGRSLPNGLRAARSCSATSPSSDERIPWPVVDGSMARYRLAIALNASNVADATQIHPPRPAQPLHTKFVQIGTDGGLLAHPVRHDHIEMARRY